MSIIIKGMKMPNNCADCPLSVIGYNEVSGEQTRICFVIPKHFPLTIHRLQDCPLVEIDDGLYEKAVNAYVLQQVRYGNVNNH